jgi:hypothetical protein
MTRGEFLRLQRQLRRLHRDGRLGIQVGRCDGCNAVHIMLVAADHEDGGPLLDIHAPPDKALAFAADIVETATEAERRRRGGHADPIGPTEGTA